MRFDLLILASVVALATAAGCASDNSKIMGGTGTGTRTGVGRLYWTEGRMRGAEGLRARGRGVGVPSPGSTPDARENAKTIRVGALFASDTSGNHFCTASVVDSPHQDVIVTAAHCVNDGKGDANKQNIAFAPGYSNGQAPFGMWTPKRYFMDSRWLNGADDRFDVAFLTVAPNGGRSVQQAIGGLRIMFNPGYEHLVRVAGYPAGADAPIACLNWTTQYQVYVKFACTGFYGGTSGSPFVTGFGKGNHDGTIVGVLGGYQEGGSTPDVSYSDYLGDDIEKLYSQAISAG